MAQPSHLALVRFWISEHQLPLGFVGLSLLIAPVLLLLVFPIGRPVRIVGEIVGFGFAETDTGPYPIARVRVENRQVIVNLPRAHTCRVGAPIRLRVVRYVWGGSVAHPDIVPCPIQKSIR